ncbi:MAG TPA: carboxypeptidase-like regulatory domain-containing protein, partial [Acidobacteriaceae bacterium]|nr:carboxypeptidase-like regulatory domain-containing protein [Acidobacteriaceae bacterium]
MRLRWFAVFALLATLCSITASAQIAADLRGTVLDPSGHAVPHAQVDLTQAATNIHLSTVTSASGDYSFTNLTPGVDRLDVTAPGFAHLTRSGVQAIVGQTVQLNLTLTLGENRQTIRVTDDAPILQSQTSNIATNIAGSTVIAMPLNTRNFVQLATLA